jgi:hypothetical protein
MAPGGMPGMPGMAPGAAVAAQPVEDPPRQIRSLRALLVTDKGLIDSGAIDAPEYLTLNAEFSDNQGWMRLLAPLSSFRGVRDRAGASLKQVALLADTKGEFYLGSLRLVQEDAPLKADAGPDRVVKLGQEVTFSAAAQPTTTAKARYAWDFDDLVDGIQEDGLGQRTTHTFEEAGFYKVTLVVTDPEGKHLPRLDRLNVTVQE